MLTLIEVTNQSVGIIIWIWQEDKEPEILQASDHSNLAASLVASDLINPWLVRKVKYALALGDRQQKLINFINLYSHLETDGSTVDLLGQYLGIMWNY